MTSSRSLLKDVAMTAVAPLDTRTPALARAHASADADGHPDDVQEVLCFRIGAEEYGVDILCVQEIRSYEAPTRLFGAAADMLGVLDLRGTAVPLVDGRVRLGAPARFDASTVTIVFNLDGRRVGLVVDQVADVHRFATQAVRPAAGLGASTARIGVTGLAARGNGALVILLDARVLLGPLN